MKNQIKITSATRDEILEIAAFLDECWKVEYRGIVAPDFLGDLSVEERHKKLLGRFDEGTSAFLIMRDGEKMIGASVFGKSLLSDKISAELKKRGFKFVGTTIICAYMHTVGLMNGHTRDCFCRSGEGLGI